MRCFTSLTIGLLLGFLIVDSGFCRPESRDVSEEEQNDADEPNDEEAADEGNKDSPPPVILSTSKNLTVQKGDTVVLPCEVKDLGEGQILWTNGTQQLFLGRINFNPVDVRISRQNNDLKITNIGVQDSGVFSCKVLVHENAPSIHYRIQVKHPAAIVQIHPSEKHEVRKDNPLSLSCQVTGFPIPQVTWVHRHRINSEKFVEHEGNEITIARADRENAGLYECVASNELNGDQPAKASVEIVVLFKPEITIEKYIINTAQDVKSELVCIVHGHPAPHVQWFKEKGKDKGEIKNGTHHQLLNQDNKHTLKIEQTHPDDFGTYRCLAKNDLGEDKKDIKVFGNPLTPTILLVSLEKRWAKLTWEIVSSSPILEYELKYRKTMGNSDWVTVKPLVQNAISDNIYRLEHVTPHLEKTSYEAVLRAKNVYGWSDPSSPQIFVGDSQMPEVPDVLENIQSKDAAGAGFSSTISLVLLLVTLVTSFCC